MDPADYRPTVRSHVDEMVRRTVAQFDPDRIVLFGSYARGNPTWDSDADLLIVMPVNGSRRERRLQIRMALHDIRFPKDILVATPREWYVQRNIPGTIVWSARHEGVILYEKV